MLRKPRMEYTTWGAVPTAHTEMSPNVLSPWARCKFLIWEFKASFYIQLAQQPLFLLSHSPNRLSEARTSSQHYRELLFPARVPPSQRRLLKKDKGRIKRNFE